MTTGEFGSEKREGRNQGARKLGLAVVFVVSFAFLL